jgi:hypothetical protein
MIEGVLGLTEGLQETKRQEPGHRKRPDSSTQKSGHIQMVWETERKTEHKTKHKEKTR